METSYSEHLIRSTRIENFLQRNHIKPQQRQNRFRTLQIVEEHRSRIKTAAEQPMYGLDARKDPSRLKLSAPPTLTWLQTNQMSLWRTMRFEEKYESVLGRHFTVHIVLHGGARSSRFEVILRIGSQPCLGDATPSFQQTFITRSATECFVEQFKTLMALEGKSCVADVSNPNALAGREMPPTQFRPPGRQTLVYGSPQVGGMLRPANASIGGGVATNMATASPAKPSMNAFNPANPMIPRPATAASYPNVSNVINRPNSGPKRQ